LNDETGKPIWKNRVDSWKEKKNEKKASAKKATAKAQVPPVEEQIMDEKE
jgi:cellulose synthase A